MRNILITAAAAALFTVGGAGAAGAEPLRLDRAPAVAADVQLTPAQYYRGRGNDWRRYCYRGERTSDCRHRLRDQQRYARQYDRRHYDNRYYDNRYDRRYDDRYRRRDGGDVAAAVALSVLGQALGVDIRGSVGDRDHYYRYRDDRAWHDWCRSRYRSYDYRSGTYMTRDGYRRYCRRY